MIFKMPAKFLFSIAFSAAIFFPGVPRAYAEKTLVQIAVHAPFEASKGVGLIINSSGASRKDLKKIEKKGDNDYVASFEVDSAGLSRDSYATAILSSEEGEFAYGTVKALSDKSQDINMIKSIPLCPAQAKQTALLESQAGTLQQLVQLRMEKRKLLRQTIASTMTDALTLKLRGLEQIFGLPGENELSSDLPAFELLNRLTRIAAAVEDVDYHKQFRATPSSTPSSTTSSTTSPTAASGQPASGQTTPAGQPG